MIPEFPDFAPLSALDRGEIEDVVRCYPPYSDFNYISLVAYDIHGRIAMAMLNGNLAARMFDYVTQAPFLTFIGSHSPLATARVLLRHSAEMGIAPALRLVPEDVLRCMGDDAGELVCCEDPDSFDYVHSVADLVSLAHVSSKRRAIRTFHDRNPHSAITEIDLREPSIVSSIQRLLQHWREAKQHSLDDVGVEFAAIERCIALATQIELISLGAFVDDELVGFTINEVIHSGFYMGHFGKTSPSYRGLCDVLEHETAKHMQRFGCTHMNHQQDLGLPGLRAAKQAWHPSGTLRKYTIALHP